MKKKDKRGRFETIAGKRVQFILDKLDSLGNCSNKNIYEYSEVDVKKMFSAIKEKLRIVEAKYSDGLDKKSKNIFKF